MQRVVLRLACIILLLFAQQSALTHAAWHAKQTAPLEQENSGKAVHGGLCDLHHAFSQVLGGVQAAMSVCFVHARAVDLQYPCLYSPGILALLPPLCRGPPSFS